VQGEPDPRWLARPDVRRGLRAVAAAGLAYDLLTLPHQLPAAIGTVRALPGLTFVLEHLSKPHIASGELQPWAALVRELAGLPNVYCKLSGMVTEAARPGWTVAGLRPYAETVLAAFGPSRVMFGSDWPVCTLAASYADVVSAARELTAKLSQDEQVQVFGGTATRAYGLPEAGHEGSSGARERGLDIDVPATATVLESVCHRSSDGDRSVQGGPGVAGSRIPILYPQRGYTK